MPIMAEAHTYQTLIKEQHLDSFGHVNNAIYLTLFEEARWDLITRNGCGLTEVLATNVGPIILQANVKFKKELLLRDTITISTRVTEYRRRLGYVHQEMRNSKGELTTVADFSIALFDMIKRELVAPSEKWLRAFGVTKL
jgi:thioesterase III